MAERHRRAAEFKTDEHAKLFDVMLKSYKINFSQFANLLLGKWLMDRVKELSEQDHFDTMLEVLDEQER